MNCPICDKELKERGFITHLTNQHKELNNEQKEKIKTELIIKQKNIKVFDIIKNYDKGQSILEIQKLYKLPRRLIERILIIKNIKIRSMSEQLSTDYSLNKYKKTVLKIYGVDNVSKSNKIKEKKKNTFIKNYGVDNIWKSKEYIEWLNLFMLEKYNQKRLTNGQKISETRNNFSDDKWNKIIEKYKKSYLDNNEITVKENLSKYSKLWRSDCTLEQYVSWRLQLSYSQKQFWKNLTQEKKEQKLYHLLNIGSISNIEKRIGEILYELNIPYSTQFQYLNKFYDYKINNTKIVIEVNGDYWHANPNKYKSDDIIKFPGKVIKAKDIWIKDKKKNENLQKIGYKLIVIWEDFMNKSSNEDLKMFILNEII